MVLSFLLQTDASRREAVFDVVNRDARPAGAVRPEENPVRGGERLAGDARTETESAPYVRRAGRPLGDEIVVRREVSGKGLAKGVQDGEAPAALRASLRAMLKRPRA
jgi:hypothetical protein